MEWFRGRTPVISPRSFEISLRTFEISLRTFEISLRTLEIRLRGFCTLAQPNSAQGFGRQAPVVQGEDARD